MVEWRNKYLSIKKKKLNKYLLTEKKRFKMWKSKKQWVYGAIIFLGSGAILLCNNGEVQATQQTSFTEVTASPTNSSISSDKSIEDIDIIDTPNANNTTTIDNTTQVEGITETDKENTKGADKGDKKVKTADLSSTNSGNSSEFVVTDSQTATELATDVNSTVTNKITTEKATPIENDVENNSSDKEEIDATKPLNPVVNPTTTDATDATDTTDAIVDSEAPVIAYKEAAPRIETKQESKKANATSDLNDQFDSSWEKSNPTKKTVLGTGNFSADGKDYTVQITTPWLPSNAWSSSDGDVMNNSALESNILKKDSTNHTYSYRQGSSQTSSYFYVDSSGKFESSP